MTVPGHALRSTRSTAGRPARVLARVRGCSRRNAKLVTGLSWRTQISAQVFEEAAVDLSRGLARYAQRGDRRVGPEQKAQRTRPDSFRLRNKKDPAGRDAIRVGQVHPRSVTLPKLGTVRVHDDTRRLRRMLRPVTPRPAHRCSRHATACQSPVSDGHRRVDRWYVCRYLSAGLPSLFAPSTPIARRGSEVRRNDRGLPPSRSLRTQWRRGLPRLLDERRLAGVAGYDGGPGALAPSAVPGTG